MSRRNTTETDCNGCAHLDAVGKELEREEKGEALVGVPEDRRVPDGKDQQGQGVVDELGRAGPPVVLCCQVGSDLSCRVVEGGLGRAASGVDAAAGQELENDDPVGRGDQPVQVSLPNVI